MDMYHPRGEEDRYVSSRGEEDQYNMRFEINKVGRREGGRRKSGEGE